MAFAFITDPGNWQRFWPGCVRIADGERWSAPGDETRLVTRLLGREVELRMTLLRFERNRLAGYRGTQRGPPPARPARALAAHRAPVRRTSGTAQPTGPAFATGWWSSTSPGLDSAACTTVSSCDVASAAHCGRP